MKLKALVFAFAAALVMAGCDSSTSSDTEIQELPESSAGQDLSSSSAKKETNSSTSKDGTGKTNSSASVADILKNFDSGKITPEQQELFKSFQEKFGVLAGDDELTEDCDEGETKSSTIMEQEVTYTCLSNIWMPTSGFDKLLEGWSQEQLEMISNFTGLTPEELKRLVEVFANADGANSNID